MSGIAYIVPTPIGNMEDLTFRAVRILKEADLVCAEDTRITRKLFLHYQITTPLASFHSYNEHKKLAPIIEQLNEGRNIAWVSDAGTPGISDPGFLIIKECITHNIPVEILPGATALIPALLHSTLPADRFCFEGFLPVKKGRQKRLKQLVDEPRTMIFYESPHRIEKTVLQLSTLLGEDRHASLSRELTKKFETHYRHTLGELHKMVSSEKYKGEMVLIVEGNQKK